MGSGHNEEGTPDIRTRNSGHNRSNSRHIAAPSWAALALAPQTDARLLGNPSASPRTSDRTVGPTQFDV